MLADNSFEEGQLIMCCEPIAFGPAKSTTKRICIGCMKPTDSKSACYQCGWTTCTEICSKLHYHERAECKIFKPMMITRDADVSVQSLYQPDCILPLRLLLLKEDDPEMWNKLIRMRDRVYDPSRHNLDKHIVKCIRSLYKLHRFSEELIYNVCDIIDRCGIVIAIENQNTVCLYDSVSYIAHNCRPNTTYTVVPTEDFKIFINASVPINEGDEIYLCRANILSPTLLRRKNLLYDKFIICDCDRCSDPSEFGTHMSSVKCHKCASYLMSVQSLDYDADWKCIKCKYFCSSKRIQTLYNSIVKDINNVETSENLRTHHVMFKSVIEKYKSKLHQTHALMVYMKVRCLLSQFDNEFEVTLSDEVINENLDLAKSMLKVLDNVAPGYTIHRAGIIFVIYKLLLTLSINRRYKKDITRKQYNKDMKLASNYEQLLSKMYPVLFKYIPKETDVEEPNEEENQCADVAMLKE